MLDFARDDATPGPPAAAVAAVLAENAPGWALPAGTRIGPFDLGVPIGEGGSSTVFRATRLVDGIRQDVALKLLRRGLHSPDAQRQYRRELQALSQLRHPGIARLIDGGVTDAGAAYLALELVEGLPIVEFVRTHRLALRARLALFLEVCRIVEAAHRALIVHRDLKPSNVLVDGDGRPHLLDFGVAKLLASDDETQTRLAPFTPAYASPEQRSGELITTATDVYSLGVVLGELMTGERLGDGDPRTPSESVAEHVDAGVLPASAPITRRLLKGDLDNIVLKALQHDPAERYASAGRFADDIERLLAGRPVSAHPPSRWYRTRKFVSRHKGGVATTVAFLLAIFAALGIAVWQAGVARRQAHAAREQAERADAIRAFLVGVFDQAEPDVNRGQPIAAQQLLALGEQQLSAGGDLQPATRLDLTVLIAHLYWDLGDYERAERLLKKAVATAGDPAIPGVVRARTLQTVAKAESEKHAFDDALAHARAAIEIARATGPAAYAAESEARRIVAESLHGKDDSKDAEPVLREALAADRAAYGDRHHAVVDDLIGLGSALIELSRFDEARSVLNEAFDLAHAVHGPVHSTVASILQLQSAASTYLGDYARSEREQRESLAIYADVYGPDHRETLTAQGNLLWTIEHEGRYEEALPDRLRMLASLERLSRTQPDPFAYTYAALGNDYFKLGRLDEAQHALQKALATWARFEGSNDEWDSADPLGILADVLRWEGRYAEAESTMRKVVEIERKHEPPGSGWLNRDIATLGDIIRQEHRHDEALRLVESAAAARRDAKPDPIQCHILSRLAMAQLDAGDLVAAYRTAADSVAMARGVFPQHHFNLGSPLFALASASLATNRATEAEPLLREALAVRSPPISGNDLRVLEVRVALVRTLRALGRGEEADRLRADIEPPLKANPSPYAAELLAAMAGGAKR
jgi:serine/threonine-protein kinase